VDEVRAIPLATAKVTPEQQWLDGSGTYCCPDCNGPERLVPKQQRCPHCGINLIWAVPRDPRG